MYQAKPKNPIKIGIYVFKALMTQRTTCTFAEEYISTEPKHLQTGIYRKMIPKISKKAPVTHASIWFTLSARG